MIRSMLVVLVIALGSQPAWCTVRIDVGYDTILTEVEPEHTQIYGRGGTSIILNNDGTVTKSSTGGVSTNSINGYVSSINKAGIQAVAHYRISNGSIVEYYENEYVRQTISIRTNGQNLCTATISTSPARGQKYIIWINPTRYFSREVAVNTVCRIRKLN